MAVVVRKLVIELRSSAPVLTKLEPGASPVAGAALAVPRSGGQPVPATVRAALAPVVQAPQARVHVGAAADAAARSVGARAFTLGNDIFFRSGAYDTGSPAGLSLLGHELTHVSQGARGILRKPEAYTLGGTSRFEAEAERNEARIRELFAAPAQRKAVSAPPLQPARFGPIRRASSAAPATSGAVARRGTGVAVVRLERLKVEFRGSPAARKELGELALASERRVARAVLRPAPIRPKPEEARGAGAVAGRVAADIESSTGSPLQGHLRKLFEPAFGVSFADVRVHHDASASRAAQAIRAEAFTLGSHVYFNRGYFSPTTPRGIALIGHELTHVAQNRGAAKTLTAKSLADSEVAARGIVDAISSGEVLAVDQAVAYAKAETILRRALEGDGSGRIEWAVGKLADRVRRKELSVAAPDRHEDQALHNERVIYLTLSGGSAPASGAASSGGDGGLALRAKAISDLGVIRRSPQGPAIRENPEPVGEVEQEILREEGIPSGPQGGILDKITGFLKGLGGTLGTIADIAISLLPVIGNIYSAACGLTGFQIIGWEPLGIASRLLCLAGAIPIPGTALGNKVGKLIDRFGSKSRVLKPVFRYLAKTFKEYAPKALNALTGLWQRLTTRIAGTWIEKAVQFAGKFANFLRLPGTAAARAHKALPQLMESIWTTRIEKLRKAGVKPEEIEKILLEAGGDVRALFNETVPGFLQKFDVGTAVTKAGEHGLTIVRNTASEYNAAVKAAKGGETIALGTASNLVHYGELPKSAAGGAALAAQDAAYLIYKEGSEWLSKIFHANPVELHEYAHVLQYMYFQKVFRRLEAAGRKVGVEGLELAGHELRTMQGWLEAVQKPAMEGMAYLFATPMAKRFRGGFLDRFMADAASNLKAGNFQRWTTSLAKFEAIRSAVYWQIASTLSFGLMGLISGLAFDGPAGALAGAASMIAGLGNKGVLIGFIRALGLMRKEREGLGKNPLDDLASERSPREKARLERRLGRALEALDKPGLPLEFSLREKLERASGLDLGQVRVHVGAEAEQLADAVGAEAFTLGNRIYFGRGSWKPETAEGLGTIVHEATHVAQFQSGRLAGAASPLRTGALEAEAYGREAAFRGTYAAAPVTVYREAVADPAPVAPAPVAATAPATFSAPVARAVPASAAAPRGRTLRKESAQRDPVQAVMDQHKVAAISQEEFLEICTERLMDLMRDELGMDAERRETLAWNHDRPGV